MIKIVKIAVFLCIGIFTFLACSGQGSSSSATTTKEKIILRVGAGHAVTSPWIAVLDNFFVPEVSKRVAENTKYEIEWIKAYGGSVIKLNDELEGIESGLVDIGATVFVFEPAKLMLQGLSYRMPFACADPVVVSKVMQQLCKEFPEFVTGFEEYNQKLLGIAVSDPYSLFSTKEVKSLSDIRGMKIGAAGANLSWIEGSGSVPVQTNLNECYQSLQTNVYAATIMPTDSSFNLKLPEVAPYFLEANFNCVIHNSIAINMDKWKSLPSEVQTIIAQVGQEYQDVEAQYVKDVYSKDVEKMKAAGVKVYTLPQEERVKWAATLPDVVNIMVKELNERGYKGSAIVSRFYELLTQNDWPKVREWKID